MSITVKNESTSKLVIPRPFVKTLAAGASVTKADFSLKDLSSEDLAKLIKLQNQGKIVITETDEVTQRASFESASVADFHQYMHIGQTTAANGAVSDIIVVERHSVLQELKCWFTAVPDAGESITIDLKRNGTSILSAALVVGSTSTSPESASFIADDLNNTDGATSDSTPVRLVSAGASFTAAHVGNLVLLNSGNANDSAYNIASIINGTTVTLKKQDGTSASMITATGQHWDMLLAAVPGDVLALTATVAGKTNLTYWCARLVLEPR